MPTGTYVDMCSKLPVVDPAKITMPTIIMRGQWDGIAGFDDLLEFFKHLPNPDKHSRDARNFPRQLQQKNYCWSITSCGASSPSQPVYPSPFADRFAFADRRNYP